MEKEETEEDNWNMFEITDQKAVKRILECLLPNYRHQEISYEDTCLEIRIWEDAHNTVWWQYGKKGGDFVKPEDYETYEIRGFKDVNAFLDFLRDKIDRGLNLREINDYEDLKEEENNHNEGRK